MCSLCIEITMVDYIQTRHQAISTCRLHPGTSSSYQYMQVTSRHVIKLFVHIGYIQARHQAISTSRLHPGTSSSYQYMQITSRHVIKLLVHIGYIQARYQAISTCRSHPGTSSSYQYIHELTASTCLLRYNNQHFITVLLYHVVTGLQCSVDQDHVQPTIPDHSSVQFYL